MPGTTRWIAAPLTLAACLAATPAPAAAAPAERVAVGQEAPEITLPDLAGTTHMLTSLRGEKNVVLVFYRGAW
jgi:AhpC/TSA family